MKTCTKCRETKDFSEFYKHKAKRDGYNCQCKQCIKNKYLQLKSDVVLQLNREIYRTIIVENKILQEDNKKLCNCCKNIFDIDELSNNGMCKPCLNEYQRNRVKTQKIKTKILEYRKTDSYKASMKKYNDKEDVKQRHKEWRLKKKLEKENICNESK